VEYLGHIVGKDGVRVDFMKIESIQDFPCPKTLNILHDFMVLMGYYRNFVKNCGKIATPLTSLLKNKAFTYNSVMYHSFQALKYSMCSTPILPLLDFTKTFVLECDTSRKGIGVILMQYGRPLAFTGKQMS